MNGIQHITLRFVFTMILFIAHTAGLIFVIKSKFTDKQKIHYNWTATAAFLFILFFLR